MFVSFAKENVGLTCNYIIDPLLQKVGISGFILIKYSYKNVDRSNNM